jgi:uncharacterized membrane protein (DUF4010 family)
MDVFVTLGISLGVGLLIGLQRERVEAGVGGIRTFPLISLFGTLCGLLAAKLGWGVLLAGFLSVIGVLVISNLAKLRGENPDPGQTTEVAVLLTFAIGAYLVEGSRAVAFVVAGITVVLLYLKQPMHQVVGKMGEHDVAAVMKFVVISLIVWPLLPNRAFGPYQVLNPYDIWRMVVLIVALSLTGYVAYKIWGQRAGTFLAGILGGLISSTATTVSYARRSKHAPQAQKLTAFVILTASVVAYVRVLVEIAVVAGGSFNRMAGPLIAMAAWMAAISAIAFWIFRGGTEELPELSNPAELKSALIFAAIYAAIIFAVGGAKERLGSGALYGIAIISGLTDMDAITLSIARMVEQDRINTDNGWHLILVASLANLVFKAGVGTFLGGWRFGLRLLVLFGIGLLGGIAILFLWPYTLFQ